MKSKKIWHSFLLITAYLLTVSLLVYLSSLFFYKVKGDWGWPLGIGIVLWIGSGLLFFAKEKNKFAHPVSLILNALASGFLISTLAVKGQVFIPLLPLLLLSLSVGVTYLFLAALLTPNRLSEKIWYVVIVVILSLTASVFFVIYLYPLLLNALSIQPPFEQDLLFVLYLVIFAFLCVGSILPTYDTNDLFSKLVLPALIATFIVGIIVLIALSGGDNCDCGDSCDCGDCGLSDGKYSGTNYQKKKVKSALPPNQ